MKYRALFLSMLLFAALATPVAAMALTATTAEVANSAPIAENLQLTTYKGIAITSRFAAVDPEGDAITFQIVDSPARGQITVDESDPAAFWYTPYEGKKGKDSFTYVAMDNHGNVSKPATVKIIIQKQNTKLTYSDMTGEAAHYSAIRLAEDGIYTGRKLGNVYCFEPDKTFTREEFLTLAMTVAGTEPLSGITLTGFFDDDSISTWAKGYVSAAVIEGAVRGSQNQNGQAVFCGDAEITCAQAAVIIDRLLVMGDVAAEPTMAAPAWASQSVANLEAVSVIPDGTDLSAPLTRGQGAQMLSAMMDVLENRSSNGWL